MTPVPNFNKWCAVSNFLFKNIDFCIFIQKTPLVKENYFLTLWNFTYLNSPLDDPGKNKIRCTPIGTKVAIYHIVGIFMLNSMHDVVSLATCAESL